MPSILEPGEESMLKFTHRPEWMTSTLLRIWIRAYKKQAEFSPKLQGQINRWKFLIANDKDHNGCEFPKKRRKQQPQQKSQRLIFGQPTK